jgi:uncharacterized membrane protein
VRVGVSSRGHSWVTMGCAGWLLFGWFVAPVLLAVYLVIGVVRLVAWTCRAIAERRDDMHG